MQICDISCEPHYGSCRKSRGKSCSAVVTMDRWSTDQQSRLHRGNHALRSSGIRSFRRSLWTRSWILGRPGDEDREARQKAWLFMSLLFLLLTSFFLSVLREGVPRGTRGGDTPPAFANQDNGSGGPDGGMSTVRMCH